MRASTIAMALSATAIIMAVGQLSGCTRSAPADQQTGESVEVIHDNTGRYYTVRCVDGVEYYITTGGHREAMAPRYNPDGSLSLCPTSRVSDVCSNEGCKR